MHNVQVECGGASTLMRSANCADAAKYSFPNGNIMLCYIVGVRFVNDMIFLHNVRIIGTTCPRVRRRNNGPQPSLHTYLLCKTCSKLDFSWTLHTRQQKFECISLVLWGPWRDIDLFCAKFGWTHRQRLTAVIRTTPKLLL